MYTAIELRKRYIIYVRAMLSFALILIGLYSIDLVKASPVMAAAYFILLVVSNFIFMFLPAQRYRGINLHYFIFMLDIAFITAGAYIFTNLNIQVIIAVFLTIFIAALSRSAALSVIIAVVVNAIYIYITLLISPEGYTLMDDNTLLNIPFIFIIALHSSYLAEKAEEENREKINLDKINILLTKRTVAKSKEAAALSDFTESLFDSFSEGILILDEEGYVRIFNKAAEILFGINKSRAEGKPINSLSALGGVKDAIMDLRFKNEQIKNRAAVIGIKKIKVSIETDFVRDKALNEIGIYCLVRREV